MHFDQPPLSTILDTLRVAGVRILIIVIVALVAFRLSKAVVHQILKKLFDREASEGTAQELSAVEIQKRMNTLDLLGGNVIRFLVPLTASDALVNEGMDILGEALRECVAERAA